MNFERGKMAQMKKEKKQDQKQENEGEENG
jgi:hypothetical protein